MIEQIQILGSQVCEWYEAPFLMFSGNVFSNLIYYSHLLPAVVALLFGILIYFSNRKQVLNKTLFLIMVLFSFWAITDLILWATEKVDLIMFFWSLLAYIEPLIYFSCFYLVYFFIRKRDVPFKYKLFFVLTYIPIIIWAPSSFNLIAFDFTNCEREALEGSLWAYIYIVEFLTIAAIAFLGIRSSISKTELTKNVRHQNSLMVIGTILFLLTLSFGNIIGNFSLDWSIAQYGLFGMPIFVVFLSYLVIRYQRFNTKLFSTQILTSGLSVLIFSLFLVQDLSLIRIITAFTLALSIVFGYLLNLSVGKEIKQRKEIELLADKLEESNIELEKANTKLRSLDKLKTEFLSLASHQLRSPLTAIKGYASMLDEGSFGKLDEKQGSAVKRIYTSAQGLVNIVEDLLNVSKIEQGGMKYEFMPTDMAGIVNNLFSEMQIPAESKQIDFKLNLPKYDKFMVNADPTKLKQVFLNLTDNSIKYTQPEGKITLSVYRDNDKIIFEVKDNGAGISKDGITKLFEKFNRSDNAKLNTGGSGLGLYLAKQIALAHKGDILIESEGLGKGSTFKVILPATGAHVTPNTMPS